MNPTASEIAGSAFRPSKIGDRLAPPDRDTDLDGTQNIASQPAVWASQEVWSIGTRNFAFGDGQAGQR
jgi:hypothetical protein